VQFMLYRKYFVNNSLTEILTNVKHVSIGDIRPQMDYNGVHITRDLFICEERLKYYDVEVKKPKEIS
jgi:hypothetical protein